MTQKLGILLCSLGVCIVGLVWSATFTEGVVVAERRAKAAADRVVPTLTAELRMRGLQFGHPVFIRVFKEERELELWLQDPKTPGFVLFKTYHVELPPSAPLGPKQSLDDGQAPEGFYVIGERQLLPYLGDRLAIDLGYPNPYDRRRNCTGSAFLIQAAEEAEGSYALGDRDIEEVYTLIAAALKNGQPSVSAHLFPFRMASPRMQEERNASSSSLPFWQNLAFGYEWFQARRYPPKITIQDGGYQFLEP